MSNIVTCNLVGGLGNQMFQICAALSYAKKFSFEAKFDLNKNYSPLQGKPTVHYKNTLFKNLSLLSSEDIQKNKFVTYKEIKFSHTEIPFFDNSLIIDGYFQSEKYFENIKDDLLKYFVFPEESDYRVQSFIHNLNTNKEITSVHIRRGDYLHFSDTHLNLPLDYFYNAVSFFNDNIFIIISDDLEWCKENFNQSNFIFSPFVDDMDDLNLMTKCDNNIVANSSFGWWGAYLNENKKKKVIAPQNWFGQSGPSDSQDIIPTNWIKV